MPWILRRHLQEARMPGRTDRTGDAPFSPVRRHIIRWLLVPPALAVARPGPATAASDTPSDTDVARQLVARADHIRFPEQGFQVDVAITTTEPDTDPEERAYRILSKGNSRTLVQTTAPPIDRNQILLMRDQDLWAFLPNLSQPIRLPLSQRLTGEVANGDLARANFAGDYVPTIAREENIDGDAYAVLQLDATEQWVTYRRVMYWVNAKSAHPRKAEFYAVSGRLLKTCRYEDFKTLGGALRPTRLVIEDALRSGRQSVLVYDHMVLRDLPDKIFTKDYLKILSR
jgi:outer membrane lipoprotein-sorting protein